MAIVENRGSSPRIPTNFRVRPAQGIPFAGRFLVVAGQRLEARLHPKMTQPSTSFADHLRVSLRASLLKLGLDLVSLFLVDAFLDVLRSALDEVLGFLQAKAGDGADFLD